MASLRSVASTCLGLSDGKLSVVADFFGYAARGHTGKLSVRAQMELVSGFHVNLNMIQVGAPTRNNENFTLANRQEIDAAVELMRKIYATVGIGVGRIQHHVISEAQAQDSGVFQSTITELFAEGLTNAWTVHNDGIDVFVVLNWPGKTVGLSSRPGPCDKDDTCVMTGSVIALEGSSTQSGIVLAHEVGHYLGLTHVVEMWMVDTDSDNVPDPGTPSALLNNVMFPQVSGQTLTAEQGIVMRLHCFMQTC